MQYLSILQHALTPEQIADLPGSAEIVHLRDINPDLWAQIAQCPDDVDQLEQMGAPFQEVIMAIKPLYDRVLLKRADAAEVVRGGIIIPFL